MSAPKIICYVVQKLSVFGSILQIRFASFICKKRADIKSLSALITHHSMAIHAGSLLGHKSDAKTRIMDIATFELTASAFQHEQRLDVHRRLSDLQAPTKTSLRRNGSKTWHHLEHVAFSVFCVFSSKGLLIFE